MGLRVIYGKGFIKIKITGSINQPAVWRADSCFIEFGMIKVDKWDRRTAAVHSFVKISFSE